MPYTILKPHFFMQNIMMASQSVAAEGVVYMAMKDGKIGMTDVRDIVDVAVKVLTEDGHEGKSYPLTGPASISFHDVAAGFSQALGKQISYVDVPVEAAREGITGMGMSEWFADAMAEYFQAFSAGYGDFATDDVQLVTGNQARPFEAFADDFAHVFGGDIRQAA